MSHAPRTIVITGATKGIGRALIDRFGEAGHVVHGCGRDQAALDALRAAWAAPCSFTSVDVGDAAAVDVWAAAVLAAGSPPDLIVNNAALMNRQVPLWEISADEWDAMLTVNVAGVAHVIRAFVPSMIEAGRGVVANLSSGWGVSTSPLVGPYCATKHAVEGLSGSLAQELPPGLACVAVSPGVVDTDMLRTCLPDTAQETDGPQPWSHRAAPGLLALGPNDNGRSISVG